MKKPLLLIIALILIVSGLFLNFYPLSKKTVVTPYEAENIITKQSTFQTVTRSTLETSYITTVKDEIKYTEDDFEIKYWTRLDEPIIAYSLKLNLKKGDQLSVTLDVLYAYPTAILTLYPQHGAREYFIVEQETNLYELQIKQTGNYSLIYKAESRAKTIPFKATVIVSRQITQSIIESKTSTSSIRQTMTSLLTETSTYYSTTFIAIPLRSGSFISYVLWGLAAALIIASIMIKRKMKPPREKPKPISKAKKHCIFCGAEIPRIAEYCEECGKKVKL